MGLEPLEFLERRQSRVLVVEMHDEADRNQVVVEMVEQGAAAGAVVERPAQGVLHEAGPVLVGLDLPQLLDADAVFLRVAAVSSSKRAISFLRQRCRARPRRTACICRAAPCRG